VRNPGLNILARLAGALAVSLPTLVSGLDHEEPQTPRRGRPRRSRAQ
jgi:hypothetical protein